MKFDVLIVGGGPAGTAAAANLMGAGFRIGILERAHYPRLKPCGGGLSYRIYARFPDLAATMRSVPTHCVRRLVFEAPSGESVEFVAPESAPPLYAMIRRTEFDHALVRHCVAGGVELREGVTVAGIEVRPEGVRLCSAAGEEFEAEIVIGADGVNSRVAVQAGIRAPWPPERLAMDSTEESPLTELCALQDAMYVRYGQGGAYGYGYLFPKATHVSAGIGYRLDCLRAQIDAKPRVLHAEFLQQLRQSGLIEGASQPENLHPWVMPVGGPAERISRDRVLIAGDAAGFVNGFTAEGIYYAMTSGELAGRAALAALRERNFSAASLRRYDRACEAELGYELRKSVELQQRLVREPHLLDRVVRFAQRSRAARRLLCAYGVGQISYRTMKRRALREALPAFVLYQLAKLWRRN